MVTELLATSTTTASSITDTDWAEFAAELRPTKTFHGLGDGVVREGARLIRKGDADYETARQVWNAMHQRYPLAIVEAAGAADVVATVNFAREHDLPITPRCGGHSIPGLSTVDDGIILDLSRMRAIQIDPVRKTARVEGGALLGELDHESQAFGLATVGGQISNTGVAGLTLNGGWGWLARRFGYTVDNLISAQVVTADGRLLNASKDENPDLFWGLRGGGGNFGVVTLFEFQLFEVGPLVYGGQISWPIEKAIDLLKFYREWGPRQVEELTTEVIAWHTEEEDGSLSDQAVISMSLCFSGDPKDLDDALAELLAFSPDDMVVEAEWLPYAVLQTQYDEFLRHGFNTYYKYGVLDDLSDEFLETAFNGWLTKKSNHTFMTLGYWGGAMSRAGDDVPFPRNKEPWRAVTEIRWEEAHERDENVQWAHDYWSSIEGYFSTKNQYLNFTGDLGEDLVRDAYGRSVYERLREVKRTYDPQNLFRMNQNIVP
ncbi:FAD-binding oxidoreductase [Microbacterium atlanticum]|uniref:FAD-binding oxidoreductase n=1 Tax=Microbacterium atlanticum TaxID=2782168 RepID=UPI00188814A0|nr:FAD-binding oxidoreductase [Microbacterium atlanticum]